jgi:CRP-like cAMP-binding protein
VVDTQRSFVASPLREHLTEVKNSRKHKLNMETAISVNYRAWGPDNIAYGPVELPALVTWIKQGKVGGNTWIFKEQDHAWARASELPELKILFKSKLPPRAAASAEALGIQAGSLRRIKLLADVDERLLASLLPYVEGVKVPQVGPVVNKGDHGDSLFMVLEGELRARVMIDNRETTLATLGVGECFGELAVVDQGPRSADVIANQPSLLLKMSEASLKKMFAEAPALAAPFMLALTRVIAYRVRAMTKKYADSIHFSRTASAT